MMTHIHTPVLAKFGHMIIHRLEGATEGVSSYFAGVLV